MSESTAKELQAELLAALSANKDRLCDGLRTELGRPIELEPGRFLRFEVDPFYYSIHSCATEEGILGDWLDASLADDWYERAEVTLGGWDAMIWAELCPWFAECWHSIGGPTKFSPAYLFFHGYHRDQFDLERRHWISATEAFAGG